MDTASLHGAGYRLVLRPSSRGSPRARHADLFGPDGLISPADEPIPVDLVPTERGARLRVGEELAARIGALIDRAGTLRRDAASDLEFLRAAPVRVYARTCGTAGQADEDMLHRLGRLGDAMLTDYGFPPPSPPKSMAKTPAAYTYLGQFLAHELTVFSPADADPALRADGIIDSAIDLKTVFLRPYGFPKTLPKHVQEEAGLALSETIVDSGKRFPGSGLDDVPRMEDGRALLFDRRNDQNLAVSQTQVAITRFAQAVQRILQQASPDDEVLHHTVLQHFQSVVLQDYLPRIVDADTWRDVMRKGRAVVAPSGGGPNPDPFFVPIEFSTAVFRFGHAMVRDDYAPWNTVDPLHTVQSALSGDLLGFTYAGGSLTDGRLLQSWTVDWRHLLGIRKIRPIRARTIGTGLSTDLFCLPEGLYQPSIFDRPCPGGDPSTINLARRTLMAGGLVGLPSGQAFARKVDRMLKDAGSPCRIPVLKPRDLAIPSNPAATAIMREGKAGTRFVDQTPLWVYILREAAILGDGNRLGPLGGRIVAETLSAAVEASGSGMIVNGIRQPFAPDPRFGGRHKRKFDYRDLVRLAFSPAS